MKLSIRKMAVAGVLGAVSIALGATPLGFIPMPTGVNATIMHLPVIVAAVAEGPVVGFFVGLIFGLFSLMRAADGIFVDPLVAVLPRVLIGLAAAGTFALLRRFGLASGLIWAAVAGTVTNTGLVLGLAVLRGYMPVERALLVAGTHGIPEVIVAAVVVTAVGMALARGGFLRWKAVPSQRNPV